VNTWLWKTCLLTNNHFRIVGVLGDGLDCIVLGGEYGDGTPGSPIFHHPMHVSRLLLGLRVAACEEGNTVQRFRPFCLVGLGLSRSDYAFIHSYFERKGILSSTEAPKHFRFSHGKAPAIWIRPEDSFLVELTGSQMFETFRFPYIRCLRRDKRWDECITVDEFKERFRKGYDFSELRAVDITLADLQKSLSRFKKQTGQIDPKNVAYASSCFSGKSVVVFCGRFPYRNLSTKDEVESLIKLHKGTVRDIRDGYKSADYCIAANVSNARVANIIQFDKTCPQILSLQFLLDCIHEGRLLIPNKYSHIVYAGSSRKKPRTETVDEFADNFYESATMESLSISLHLSTAASEQINTLPYDNEDVFSRLAFKCLHGMRVLMKTPSDGTLLTCGVIIKFNGGHVFQSNNDANGVTHILVNDVDQQQELHQWMMQVRLVVDNKHIPFLVDVKFINDLVRQCHERNLHWSDCTSLPLHNI
jgi:hypothetical protein